MKTSVTALAIALSVQVAPAWALDDVPERDGSEIADDTERRADAIVVTGTLESRELQKLDTPVLGISIDKEQIAAINAINTEDVIRYAPDLIVRKRYIGDANATLSFRNMHTTQTPRALVTVDGFLISDFLGADFDTAPKWAVLGPGDIERAEIIYGPTSARYSGNSLGGTLRLETRDVTERAIRLNAQTFFQNYQYYATDEDLFGYAIDGQADLPVGDSGGVTVAYRHFENEGQPQQWRTVARGTPFADQAIVDDGLGFPLRIAAQDSVVKAREDQVRVRGKLDLDGNWQMRALGALLFDRDDTADPRSFLRDANGGPTFIGISGVTRGISESTELLTGLGIAGNLPGWAVDVAASHYEVLHDRTRSSDPVNTLTGIIPDSGLVTDADERWTNVEATAERAFGPHSLAVGVSYMGYHGKSRTAATSDLRAASGPVSRNASGGETRVFGVFAEDAIAFLPKWKLTLGLRYENWRAGNGFLVNGDDDVRYPSRTRDALSPKAALTYMPDTNTEIVASAAWATRFPTIGELYQASLISFGPNVGSIDLDGFNPDLDPERGFDLQLTGSHRFGNTKLTLSGFRQNVEDTLFSQTILVPNADNPDIPVSQSLITNIGAVDTWGVDFIVAAEDILIAGLSFDGNITWLDAEIKENPLNPALVGNKFPRVPKWRANASLRYAVSPGLDLAANFRYQSTPDRNLENNSSSKCDTFYCVSTFSFVDLKATAHLGPVDLDFGVDNLLDEKAFVFHPYPGRTFVASLRWKGNF